MKTSLSVTESDSPTILPPFNLFRRKLVNLIALLLGDSLSLSLSLLLGGGIRWFLKGDTMVPSWLGLVVLAWWFGAYGVRLLPGWGLGAAEELRRQLGLLVAIFSMTTAAVFLGKNASEASRLTLSLGFLIAIVLVPLLRLQVKHFLIYRQIWGVPTVIYGDAQTIPVLAQALRGEGGLGYTPVGVFCDDGPQGGSVAGLPVLGRLSGLTRAAPVAVIALPGLSRHELIELLDGPLTVYRHILLVPDLMDAPSLWVQPRDLQGILGLEITSNLLDPFSKILKRLVELILVWMTLPLWGGLCLFLLGLIRLVERESGLFFQERIGFRGKQFKTLKFRTMHLDAEKKLEDRLQKDPALREEWEKNFKLKQDPRITQIGRLLRLTSLDELPQLVNVLRGEMSLVGPRPLPAYHYYGLTERVRVLRDRVRPGITGLWQVSCRSESGIEGMERWDTYYVRNWSIWLDFVILFRTFRAVLKREGAY